MNNLGGYNLVENFIKSLNEQPGIKVIRTSISRNVFEYTGRTNLLLYIKGRAKQPLRWGVTANVVQRLQSQSKPWFVILLFESYDKGYFLTQYDVENYMHNTWPFAKDGDYKPAPGSYLSCMQPLYSLHCFIDSFEKIKVT